MDFPEIKAYAEDIKTGYGGRDSLYDKIEDAYLLREVELPSYEWIKPTISPDARNKTNGAVRLLTAADPKWSVPRDKNKGDMDERIASQLEKAAGMIWAGSNKVRGKPVHYTAALAALLYGQCDISVNVTAEIAQLESNPVRKKRIERAAQLTPLIFEALSPRVCFPVFDAFGLTAHYTFRKMKVVDVISRWGDKARNLIGNKKMTEEVDYSEFWNDEFHAAWVGGVKDALLFEPHGLSRIPIASAVVEGGDLFDSDESIQPFLYTIIKSHIHERQSLMLTLMYSNAFTTGATPTSVYRANDPNKTLRVDYSQPGGIITIDTNEDLSPLKRDVIDKSMSELYQIAGGKADESTIYSQTLGEPLGGNAPYSMVALLSQSGRLPLVPYQRMLSNIITNVMSIGIDRLREGKEHKIKVNDNDTSIELNLKEIPENIELIATLDIELPQDSMSDSRMALELTNNKLISRERARSKYLQVEQSDEEDKQIMKEAIRDIMLQNYMQEQTQAMQMKAQQMQQQMQMQQQQGQQQMPPPGMGGQMPEGMTPEMMQQIMQGGGQGMPPQGQPLPPQAAQAGMPMVEPMRPQGEPTEADMMGMPPGGI